MNKLWWSLVCVAHTLSHVCCLRESVDSSEGQQQGHSLELTATSIRQLTELAEKLDKKLELVQTVEERLKLLDKFEKRFEEYEMINQQLRSFLETSGRKEQEPRVDPVKDQTINGQTELHLEKRSDDAPSWEPVVAQVTQRLNLAEANIQALKNLAIAEQQARGTVYVRWGQNVCPTSADLVYPGYVGGSWYDHSGAATNYLCLPHDPFFVDHTVPKYGHANVFGAEYQTCDEPECDLNPTCAVCRISRESSVMLPARNTCYPGWTLEYSGYLMTNGPNFAASMEYICVDSSFGYIHSSKGNDNGALLQYTTYQCGSLSCPPYIGDKIVLCAVCSK